MSEINFETDGVFPDEAPSVEAPETATETITESTAPTESPAPPAAPPQKGHGKGLRIAAIAVAAVVVLGVVAAFAVPAIIRAVNPKAAVLSALSKTLDNAGFDDAATVAAVLQKGAFKQDFSLRLGNQYPASLDMEFNFGLGPGQLSGTGFSYTLEMDKAAKKLGVNLGVDIGAYHAADVRFFADNSLFSFGSPELTGNKFYQFNTETFGADWNASPYWSTVEDMDPTLGFNIFDAPTVGANPAVSAETAAFLTQLSTDLNKASPMTKEGNVYTLTVPANAFQTYWQSVSRALSEDEIFNARRPEWLDLSNLADRFQDGANGIFTVDDGAVTRMELTLPFRANEEETLLLRFYMTTTEEGGLSILLEGEDDEGNVDISASTKVQVSTDKTAKQLGIDLPKIIVNSDGESLTISASVTMGPLTEFSFQPGDSVAFMELDQSGVLELLLGVLGGLQGISEGVRAGY